MKDLKNDNKKDTVDQFHNWYFQSWFSIGGFNGFYDVTDDYGYLLRDKKELYKPIWAETFACTVHYHHKNEKRVAADEKAKAEKDAAEAKKEAKAAKEGTSRRLALSDSHEDGCLTDGVMHCQMKENENDTNNIGEKAITLA